MGHLDLYHRTTPAAAAAILREKRMTSKERGDVFFSTSRDGGQAEGYGDAVVHVRVPEHLAELDDEFPDGEQHYKIHNRHLKPQHFVGARVVSSKDQALARLEALPDNMIQGRHLNQLYREHNIHFHEEDPYEAGEVGDDHMTGDTGTSIHHSLGTPLHTSQAHLWKHTLRHFIENPGASGDAKRPHTWTHAGQHWIGDGHHRIVADRMLGSSGMTVSDRTPKTAAAEEPAAGPQKDAHRLRFSDPEEDYTGGSKWRNEGFIRAQHPEHGEVGHVQYLRGGRANSPIMIKMLKVHPDHQRKGYGSALMDQLQTAFPKAKIDHGDRTDAGKGWWDSYGKGKADSRGRTSRLARGGTLDVRVGEGQYTVRPGRICDGCGGTGYVGPGDGCGACDESGRDPECLCGLPVAKQPGEDWWSHLDGSIGHDGEFYGHSVADLMRHVAAAAEMAKLGGKVNRQDRNTDWAKIQGTNYLLHRGVGMDLSPEDHAIVHDSSLPKAERAHHLLGLFKGNQIGEHWSTNEKVAHHYSHLGARYATSHDEVAPGTYGRNADGSERQRPRTRVVVHAEFPDVKHVNTDPEATTYGYSRKNDEGMLEREVPLHEGTQLKIHGVSWGLTSYGRDDPAAHDRKTTKHIFDEPPQHTASTKRATAPTKRLFGPTFGLDRRLFDGEHLKADVTHYVLGTLDGFWRPVYGAGWKRWARVYLAGSEASEWTSETLEGNNDFDILVGVEYDRARADVPLFADASDEEITQALNTGFREQLIPRTDPVTITIDGAETGPWSNTWYVNADSWDIVRIKPYAAYDVTNHAWAVKPPHLPDWDIEKFPEGHALVEMGEAYEKLIGAIFDLPEPYRTQQGNALWTYLHTDRSRAFSSEGEGWYDPGNVMEKWLDQNGTWADLWAIHHRADEDPSTLLAPADWSNDPTR
jgi:GNAT superfamily N-acetyltransferase